MALLLSSATAVGCGASRGTSRPPTSSIDGVDAGTASASGLELDTDEPVAWGQVLIRNTSDDPIELRALRATPTSHAVTQSRTWVVREFETTRFSAGRLSDIPRDQQRHWKPLRGALIAPGEEAQLIAVFEGATASSWQIVGPTLELDARGRSDTVVLPHALGVCADPCEPGLSELLDAARELR